MKIAELLYSEYRSGNATETPEIYAFNAAVGWE